jgi:hypothetical protein
MALIAISGTTTISMPIVNSSREKASNISVVAWRMLRDCLHHVVLQCVEFCNLQNQAPVTCACTTCIASNPAGRSPKAAGPQIMFAHDRFIVPQSRLAVDTQSHDKLRYFFEVVRPPPPHGSELVTSS